MTNEEALLLEKGRVPMTMVQEALATYRSQSDHTLQEDLLALSERAEVPYDTLETWVVHPDRSASVEFDTADRVLCACFLYNWWYSRYDEFYYNVNLNMKQCERDGCQVWFDTTVPHMGGVRHTTRKYCSRTCGQMAWLHEKGKIQNSKKKNLKTHCRNGHKRTPENTAEDGACMICDRENQLRRKTECSKGHKFTPENTMFLKSGKRRCRTCHNARSKTGYHRTRGST